MAGSQQWAAGHVFLLEGEMQTGTICRVVAERGFGFIAAPGQPDLFWHCGDLVGLEFSDRLREMRVMFDIVETDKGPRAKNVQAVK